MGYSLCYVSCNRLLSLSLSLALALVRQVRQVRCSLFY